MGALFLVVASFFFSSCQCVSPHEKLIVVSFDGFRFDYLSRGLTPNLLKFKEEGASARFLMNIFPTQTFPNHFSLATGMYAETHGVLASKVYNAQTKKLMKYGYELWHYNDNIIPIWVHNQQSGAGRYSGVTMWPGSNFPYNGTNATFTLPYDKTVPWEKRINTVIEWFLHKETPINLCMIYFEEPDKHEHPFGPNSDPTNQQIERVDKIAQYLVDQLKANKLFDVNVIFLSDHGMEGVNKERIIDLYKYVNKSDCDMYGSSPVLQVYPKPGKENHVYTMLKANSLFNQNYTVYLKEDIPEHFHYKNSKRTPPILAVAKPTFGFQDLYSDLQWYMETYNISENATFGIHGYDPKTINMHPYFIGIGPQFKPHFEVNQLYTVDMFTLFSHVLNLGPPKVKTNGTYERVSDIFKNKAAPSSPIGLYLILGLTACFASRTYLLSV